MPSDALIIKGGSEYVEGPCNADTFHSQSLDGDVITTLGHDFGSRLKATY